MPTDEVERVVLGYGIDWSKTDEVKFESLPADLARELVEKGQINPEERCDGSPTMGRIVDFMETYSGSEYSYGKIGEMIAHGRIFAPDSGRDARVLLEGVQYSGKTSDEFVLEFARLFHDADTFMLEKDLHAKCWYSEKTKTGKR